MESRKAKVPKRFRLMGRTITVQRISKAKWQHADAVAYFDPERMLVCLCSGYPPDVLEQAFWHEATHAILYVMNHDLYTNEQFVDTFAGLVHQIIRSSEA